MPIFEFLHSNERFHTILLEPLTTKTELSPTHISPLPYSLLTLASYLLTHATSVHAPRAIGYAHLSLNILLVMAESKVIMEAFCNRGDADIRLCRQVSFFHTPSHFHSTESPETTAASGYRTSHACLRHNGLLCVVATTQLAQALRGPLISVS